MWGILTWLVGAVAAAVKWAFWKPAAAALVAGGLTLLARVARKDTAFRRVVQGVAYAFAVPAAAGLVYSWTYRTWYGPHLNIPKGGQVAFNTWGAVADVLFFPWSIIF